MLNALFLSLALLAAPASKTHLAEDLGGRPIVNGQGWEDALMGITQARVPSANYPDFGAFPSGSATSAYLFGDAADECVEGSIQLSHNYKAGSSLYCHVHWSPLTTDVTNVVWQMDYTVAAPGQAFGASQLVYKQTPGEGAANKHQVAAFSAITCAACAISSVMQLRVCRDGNGTNATDDMTGDVAAHYVDCHVQIDSLGSRQETVK